MEMVVLLLLLLASVPPVLGIRVLRSQVALEDDGRFLSGARLDDDRPVDMEDVTFCVRFNYKLLGRWEQKSQLIHIEDWRTEPGVSGFAHTLLSLQGYSGTLECVNFYYSMYSILPWYSRSRIIGSRWYGNLMHDKVLFKCCFFSFPPPRRTPRSSC